MNVLSPMMFEELIGRQMAQLAYSEGHKRNFPQTDRRVTEKEKIKAPVNHRNAAIGARYRQIIFMAIRAGLETANKIAQATDISTGSVRKALRQLEADGMIQRAGHTDTLGGKQQIWKITTP